MKNIVLIRHATTEFNEKGLIQGQKDSPISPKGKFDIDFVSSNLKN